MSPKFGGVDMLRYLTALKRRATGATLGRYYYYPMY